MALATVVASFFILLTCYVHYRQHFQLVICAMGPGLFNQASVDHVAALYRTRPRARRCCSLMPRDDENFDFFPRAFWFYLCLQYALTLLVLAVESVNYASTETTETILEFVLGNPLRAHHRDSLRHIHDLDSYYTDDALAKAAVTLDYILIYGLLVACLCESFFCFFRYRSTLVTAVTLADETVSVVFKRFIPYGVAFAMLFVMTVHWHYLICAPLVLLYMVFNLYCTYKFCAILIERFRFMLESGHGMHYSANAQILDSIYLLRRSSLSCCVMHCVSLAVFVFFQVANVVYFLPLLWAVTSLVFSLNFIRNRRYLEGQCVRCRMWCQLQCLQSCKRMCACPSTVVKRGCRGAAPPPPPQVQPDADDDDDADGECVIVNELEHESEYEHEESVSVDASPYFVTQAPSPSRSAQAGKLKRGRTLSSSPLSKADSLRGTRTGNHLIAPLTMSPPALPLPILRDSESATVRTSPMNMLQKMKRQNQSRSANALSLGVVAASASAYDVDVDGRSESKEQRAVPVLKPAKSDPVSGANKTSPAARAAAGLSIAGQRRSRSNVVTSTIQLKKAQAPSPIRSNNNGRPKAFDLLGITPNSSPLKRFDSARRMQPASASGSPQSIVDFNQGHSKPPAALTKQSSFAKFKKFMRSNSAAPGEKRTYLNMDNDTDAKHAMDAGVSSDFDADIDLAIEDAIEKAFSMRPTTTTAAAAASAPDGHGDQDQDVPSGRLQLQLEHVKSNSLPVADESLTSFDWLRNLGFINQQSLRSMQELSWYHRTVTKKQQEQAKPRLSAIDWNEEQLQPADNGAQASLGSEVSTPVSPVDEETPYNFGDLPVRLSPPNVAPKRRKRKSFFQFGFATLNRSQTSRT